MDNYIFRPDRLKELRKALGIKQDTMAKDLNISAPTLSRYETGERQPSIQTLFILSGYLNVSVDYLLQQPLRHFNSDEILIQNNSLPGVIANSFNSSDLMGLSEDRIQSIIQYISDQVTLSKLKDGNRI